MATPHSIWPSLMGTRAAASALIKRGAEVNAKNKSGSTPLDIARSRGHAGTVAFLAAQGGVRTAKPANAIGASPHSQPPTASQREGQGAHGFHPDAPFTTAESFSRAIGRPAVLLDSPNVSILAPKDREKAAAIVLPYLVRAYDELHKIVGVHTKYKILIYAYPKGTPGVRGGTSGCVIKYTDENLDLASQPEWREHRVPHVSGYVEEMAHNFVHASGAEFGWEMIGWPISVKVSQQIAPNPIHQRAVAETHQNQDQTYQRYMAAHQTFPADLRGDQADRIHAYLLRKCEQQYGPGFWHDFFKEVRKEQAAFSAPEAQGDSRGLDVRYRLTVECFDRLPGLKFKKLLARSGISTTVAIQSLKPTQPAWNRKLQ
jgi:hypothetical protein